jgi:hypothetical protein
MSDTLRRSRPLAGVLVCALALSAGCGNELTLPPATAPIAQQQIHLFALTETPVGTPSAYNMIGLGEVQTFRSNDFDFAFDIGIDSTFGLGTKGDTIAVLIPRGGLGFTEDAGLQFTLVGFDSIQVAPTTGYEKTRATRIRAGDVVLAASRPQTCNFGFVRPRYAKLQIGSIDIATRSAVILVVIDTNCGYRGLGVGIPSI